MHYIQESLATNERLIYATRPHWIVFAPGILTLVVAFLAWRYIPRYLLSAQPFWKGYYFHELLAAAIVVVAIIALLRAYIFFSTSEYGITNRRVIMKTGWIRRHSVEVFLQRIEGLSVNQTIPGRIFNYGTVLVVGTGGTSEFYPNVPSPVKFHRLVLQMAESISKEHPRQN